MLEDMDSKKDTTLHSEPSSSPVTIYAIQQFENIRYLCGHAVQAEKQTNGQASKRVGREGQTDRAHIIP